MIKVEIVIRKKIVKDAIKQFSKIITKYKTYESDDRCVLNVDSDWEGFRDDSMFKMIRELGEGMYLALAYFTNSDFEIVVDIEGNPVDKYSVVIDGLSMTKYVKKKLMIIKMLDKEVDKFEVKAYMISLELVNPVVKILDVYSYGKESGFVLSKVLKKV